MVGASMWPERPTVVPARPRDSDEGKNGKGLTVKSGRDVIKGKGGKRQLRMPISQI